LNKRGALKLEQAQIMSNETSTNIQIAQRYDSATTAPVISFIVNNEKATSPGKGVALSYCRHSTSQVLT
jgi:hypothetical protein